MSDGEAQATAGVETAGIVYTKGKPHTRVRAQSDSAKEREKAARILLIEKQGKVTQRELSAHVKERTGMGISGKLIVALRESLGYGPSYGGPGTMPKSKAARKAAKLAKVTRGGGRPSPLARLSAPTRAEFGAAMNTGALAEAMELLVKRYGVVELHFRRGVELRVTRETVVRLSPEIV